MTNNMEINFKEVVARFQNSAEVLSELQERLSSLASTDKLHRETVESAQAAASSLGGLVDQIRGAVDILNSSLLVSDSALIAAREFLEMTDLSEVGRLLRELIDTQKTDASQTQKQISGIESALTKQVTALQSQVNEAGFRIGTLSAENEALRQDVERIDHAYRALQAKVSQVPDKVRNKFGL